MDETDAQRQPYWPHLEELARPARERRRLSPDVRRQIILSLCRYAPLSVKELSILLDRSEAYVGDAIRPLVNSGALTFLYPDQPRHPRQKYMAGTDASGPDADLLPELPELPDEVALRMPEPPREPRKLPEPAYPRPTPPPTSIDDDPGLLPNQWTNLAYVGAVGLVLGLTGVAIWWLFALAAASALSWLHVVRDSGQFRKFEALTFLPNRVPAFLLLKSAVAFLEIAVVYVIIRALGPNS